jgi:hypothetical protein
MRWLVAILLLTSCKSVTIPDEEWCADMGVLGATCFHTLSPASRDIAKPDWDVVREGMLCTVSDSFAANKDVIEKLCHETNDCDYQSVTKFFARVSQLGGTHK